jgi:hypothetical protein
MVLVAKSGMITYIYSQDWSVHYCQEAPELSRKGSQRLPTKFGCWVSFLKISEKWTSWEYPSQYGKNEVSTSNTFFGWVSFLEKN